MAVLVYLGVGISSFPTRLPDALSAYVGADRAEALQGRVESLLKEALLDSSNWATSDLAAATRRVEESARAAHPELSEDAIEALGWDFSFQSR